MPNIIFEDDILIIVDKPAGMPTQSSEAGSKADLYSEMKSFLNQRESREIYLALHHRLDAATSGLVLFCKNPKFNKAVTDLFRDKKIEKKYLAWVDNPRAMAIENEWIIENKLIEYKFKNYKKAKSSKNGKPAKTTFRLIENSQDATLIECIPHTGRLHQIRVHLAEYGLPIQGDFHYNPNYKKSSFKLRAFSMRFHHPKTNKELIIEANNFF